MEETIRITRRLQKALKLSGYNIRINLCEMMVRKFVAEHINIQNANVFDECIKLISNSLEKQDIHDRCIEAENIERAIEMCLNSGCDKHETILNVINAFDFPKFQYNLDRKKFHITSEKPQLLSVPDSKAMLFLERYSTILQRTQRNFKNKLANDESESLSLQTVDYLLTLSNCTLDKTLILGSLLMVAEGKYVLEDPTGFVELDLSHAQYTAGFFVETIFVLVNGVYDDKKLMVSTMILPPGEEYTTSKLSFGNLNYFGGASQSLLRESTSLKDQLRRASSDTMLIFSDVWLDHSQTFEKLELLLTGMDENPPIAFIFMGNFMSESHGVENIDILRKLFKQLGALIGQCKRLVGESRFIFVPGMQDPCTPHIVPRLPLPAFVTNELKKFVPNAIFATNPCRLQYCNKEIVLFRADVLVKLMQDTFRKPSKDNIANSMTRTIISQGHLSPLSLNALTVNWDFDYALRLYPLPNLVVIGDKSETYQGEYMGCKVVNPGSFCESGFQFKCYTPLTDSLEDCSL